jgi:hypothetical protein
LVGFFEYTKALQILDDLIANSTPEELAAYDRIVASSEQYSVYTNLAHVMGERGSAFAMIPSAQNPSKKSGLAWLVALARLERNAMIMMYGKAAGVVETQSPTRMDAIAYRNLLLDGMQTQYIMLARSPDLELMFQHKKAEPDSQMIAYTRQLTLAITFHLAVQDMYHESITVQQQQELSQRLSLLGVRRDALLKRIDDFLEQEIPLGGSQEVTEFPDLGPQFGVNARKCLSDCRDELRATK